MDAVRETPELRRVRDLPRRTLAPTAQLVAEMTEVLSLPSGSMRLRPLQAAALLEIATCGGAFCPLGVGEGKTLISLLAPYVLDSKRPLLVLPANLIQKTQRDQLDLSAHWLIPRNIRLMSYEILGRVQAEHELETYEPDLIIADEAHRLKNRRAAVTRRVARYMHAHPGTRFVALSGTMMRKSLLEFGTLLRWALKENAPIPKTEVELEEWAAALDEFIDARREAFRSAPGALLAFCTPEDSKGATPTIAARRGFRRRLVETAGVIPTAGDGERVDCSLHIAALRYDVQPVTERHFRTLREAWELPSGEQLCEGVEVWRHARELALGMHYRWDPPAPKDWLEARKKWAAFVRGVLSHSRSLDSEKAVALAVDAGRLSDGGALTAWREIKPSFEPNPVAVWHDDSALNACAAWMHTPGIVWTEHYWFADRLARATGCRYYGAEGLDREGRFIDDAPNDRAVIASIKANREGRNLQKAWSRNLVVSPPEGADVWQQMIGRTHRPGQLADEVTVDVLLGCAEHIAAWRKAHAAARAVRDTTGADSKLLLADVEWPGDFEIARWMGFRWNQTGTKTNGREAA